MIKPKDLIKKLNKNKINFFTGVPDSILKNLSPYFEKKRENHISAANEGSAIALATGYYLSTKKVPCVYIQNSGLGNAINPLASLTHSKVYSIPILLMIGWRGSPNLNDEPQHEVKGAITREILKLLGIKFCILRKQQDFNKLEKLIKLSKLKKIPVACLIEKKTLIKERNNSLFFKKKSDLKRIKVIEELLKKIKTNTNIVSTTGFTSRELMELRKKEKKGNDFYMVGAMGHSAALSLAISLNSKKQTICLDGDGSLIMHLGSLATIGFFGKNNFKHILFNNNAHESVGGQKTNINKINFQKFIEGIGYRKYIFIKSKKELNSNLNKFLKSPGPVFMEINTSQGSIKNLMRPGNLIKIKNKFMSNV